MTETDAKPFSIPRDATEVLIWSLSGYESDYLFIRGSIEQVNPRTIRGTSVDPIGTFLACGVQCVIRHLSGHESSLAEVTDGIFTDDEPEIAEEEQQEQTEEAEKEAPPNWARYEIIWVFDDDICSGYSTSPLSIVGDNMVAYDEDGRLVRIFDEELCVICLPINCPFM